jgi:AcrR family transcriptional regulator
VSDDRPDPPSELGERILAAAYECVGRFGLSKTTVDEVARVSGVSRATIYRVFPGGREQLMRETVGWEMTHFFARLAEVVDDAPDLATRLERGLAFARRSVLDHAMLQKVLAAEPGALMPLMTVEQHRVLLEVEQSAGRLRAGVDLDAAADYVARMLLSLIGSPGRWDLSDDGAVRAVVHGELLGGILAPDGSGDRQ